MGKIMSRIIREQESLVIGEEYIIKVMRDCDICQANELPLD